MSTTSPGVELVGSSVVNDHEWVMPIHETPRWSCHRGVSHFEGLFTLPDPARLDHLFSEQSAARNGSIVTRRFRKM